LNRVEDLRRAKAALLLASRNFAVFHHSYSTSYCRLLMSSKLCEEDGGLDIGSQVEEGSFDLWRIMKGLIR
jgi:hypothetical protein